jgi:hypothetical protein
VETIHIKNNTEFLKFSLEEKIIIAVDVFKWSYIHEKKDVI